MKFSPQTINHTWRPMLLIVCLLQTACLSTVVGVAVGTTVAVVKVPFKVAGAAVDLAIPDGDDEKDEN